MTKVPPAFCSAVLFALFLNLLACGNTPPRQLVSATVMPATATASSFPNGMVQFTATGRFDRPPSPAVLNPAMWQLEPSALYPADAVSISASGVAQCKAGFTGTVTIQGGGEVCPPKGMGIPCQFISGQAQLTCP